MYTRIGHLTLLYPNLHMNICSAAAVLYFSLSDNILFIKKNTF